MATTVPIYILDGSSLSSTEILALSVGLNLADSCQIATLREFCDATVLTYVTSRPYFFQDRFWLFQNLLTEISEERVNSDLLIVDHVGRKLDEDLHYFILRVWFNEGSEQLAASPWGNLPMVVNQRYRHEDPVTTEFTVKQEPDSEIDRKSVV